jgi:AcrR family transcriptional regulator
MSRKYEQKERATSAGRTRDRIIAATLELHSSVGPGRTSIAQIAERAGVQRHTVYRHFPSQQELLAACSQHYWTTNQWRPVDYWNEVRDAGSLQRELSALYGFYEQNQDVIFRSLHDAVDDPGIEVALRAYREYVAAVHASLVDSLSSPPARNPDLEVMIKHALAFETWYQLCHEAGATSEQAARLMSKAVADARASE